MWKKCKYDPQSTYKYNIIDCNIMNIIFNVFIIYVVKNLEGEASKQEYHWIHRWLSNACYCTMTHGRQYFSFHQCIGETSLGSCCCVIQRKVQFVYDSYSVIDHNVVVYTEIEKWHSSLYLYCLMTLISKIERILIFIIIPNTKIIKNLSFWCIL